MPFALVALAVALACTGVMLQRVRRLQRVELPSAAELARRAKESGGEAANPARVSLELDELLRDLDGDTRALPELASALGRVSLASGTALALLTIATKFGFASLPFAGTCFGAGVVGTTAVSYLGRMASARSRRIRAHWSDASAKARRLIGVGDSVPEREGRLDPA